MLAAAAAVAEAAARDAAETEAQQQGGDAVLSAAMTALAGEGGEIDSSGVAQEASPYTHEQQIGFGNSSNMAVEPVSEVGRMDQLLQQMVAEQQQVEREQQFRKQLAAAAVAEAARLNRPQEHFITIASNGMSPGVLSVCSLPLSLSFLNGGEDSFMRFDIT